MIPKKIMLCFDIETTGLSPKDSKITVVCVENFVTGETFTYEFARYPESFLFLRAALIKQFDNALSICGFNAIRFDIPFLATELKIDEERKCAWVFKTSDILEQSRLLYKSTFGLNLLCQANKIPVKISDGKEAIKMAKEGRWDELNAYCAMDVSILSDIYRKRRVKHPRCGKIIDLTTIARPNLYTEHPNFFKYCREAWGWTPKKCQLGVDVIRSMLDNDNFSCDEGLIEDEEGHRLSLKIQDRVWCDEVGFKSIDNDLSKTFSGYRSDLISLSVAKEDDMKFDLMEES